MVIKSDSKNNAAFSARKDKQAAVEKAVFASSLKNAFRTKVQSKLVNQFKKSYGLLPDAASANASDDNKSSILETSIREINNN